MASSAAYAEVRQFLVDNWGGSYQIVDFEEADESITQGETPFIAIEETAATEDIIAVAGIRPLVDEVAPFTIHLFFPSGEDRGPARTLADQIAVKGRQRILTAGRIARVHPPNPGILNNGLWHSMLVDIEYELSRRPTVEREITTP